MSLIVFVPRPSVGDVTFVVSPDPTVTDYIGKVYAQGTVTPVLASQEFGKPPAPGGVCRVNIQGILAALPAGNYDVTITAVSPGGSTESAVSNVFTVPLVAE
jgi:hypothetical protein